MWTPDRCLLIARSIQILTLCKPLGTSPKLHSYGDSNATLLEIAEVKVPPSKRQTRSRRFSLRNNAKLEVALQVAVAKHPLEAVELCRTMQSLELILEFSLTNFHAEGKCLQSCKASYTQKNNVRNQQGDAVDLG
eukprot:Skav213205  [mRNA]  locus=scaffold2826:467145:473644:- [translate_table: standard]